MKINKKECSEIIVKNSKNELLASITDANIIEAEKVIVTFRDDESARIKEEVQRFNANEKTFIMTEALKIFCNAENDKIALRALELLEKAAQNL